MKYLLSALIAVLLLISLDLYPQIQEDSSPNRSFIVSKVQGVWVVVDNPKRFLSYDFNKDDDSYITNDSWVENEFLIFKGNDALYIATHDDEYGLELIEERVKVERNETFRDNGQYVDGSFVLSYNVFEPRNSISKKAQKRLYDYCADNHINYAREFLDYDICGVNENCSLLDSTYQKTTVTISKGDIVIVKKIDGDYLKVSYEDSNDDFYEGYLNRKSLDFIINE
ncbi:MAG: hypothetical protein UH850_16275 [Paludibacteraceae bacterium]|nr:hypothetical protein [Paludibacteraceae bacterium]MEE1085277.1 hypothetical protein [Paludibacteraceae bacterium]